MKLIIYTQDNGIVAIVRPTEEALATMTIEQIAAKDVPAGIPYSIVDDNELPSDRTLRNAWEKTGDTVTHNMLNAKLIAHNMRRARRATELAPLDDIIAKQIPGKSAADAEVERRAIRARDAQLQIDIDACETADQLLVKLAQLVD